MKNRIIEMNLERLTSSNQGDLGALKFQESIGGNAGVWQGLPCLAANFYYDEKNGFIIYFGNSQHVPQRIKSKYRQGTLRIAINFSNGVEKVVDLIAQDLIGPAKENLEGAILAYNSIKENKNVT